LVKESPTIALFGGSFDPPHRGHQVIVGKIASFHDIDRVIVMPAFLNPFKKTSFASAQKRLLWCRKICNGEKVIVSDFEIRKGRSVYTIETLTELQKKYYVKYLVIGSDNIDQIESWKEFKKINETIIWIVITRSNSKIDYSKLKKYKTVDLDIDISSTAIRKGISLEYVDKHIREDIEKMIKETHDNQRES